MSGERTRGAPAAWATVAADAARRREMLSRKDIGAPSWGPTVVTAFPLATYSPVPAKGSSELTYARDETAGRAVSPLRSRDFCPPPDRITVYSNAFPPVVLGHVDVPNDATVADLVQALDRTLPAELKTDLHVVYFMNKDYGETIVVNTSGIVRATENSKIRKMPNFNAVYMTPRLATFTVDYFPGGHRAMVDVSISVGSSIGALTSQIFDALPRGIRERPRELRVLFTIRNGEYRGQWNQLRFQDDHRLVQNLVDEMLGMELLVYVPLSMMHYTSP